MNKISKFDLARIMARIDKTKSGCWLWTGNKQLQIWLNDTPARVPRLLYDYYNEKSCDRYQLGFRCGNRRCVNPAHVFLLGKLTKRAKPSARPKSFLHQSAKFWAHVFITETCWLWQGFEIHHTCQNKLCVNPAHLKPLSRNDHKRLHVELKKQA